MLFVNKIIPTFGSPMIPYINSQIQLARFIYSLLLKNSMFFQTCVSHCFSCLELLPNSLSLLKLYLSMLSSRVLQPQNHMVSLSKILIIHRGPYLLCFPTVLFLAHSMLDNKECHSPLLDFIQYCAFQDQAWLRHQTVTPPLAMFQLFI